MTHWTAIFANPFAERLGSALLAFLWQGTLVAAALASFNVMLRHRSARLRYAVCCAALLAMLLLPVATFARRGGQRGLAAADPTSEPGLHASIMDSALWKKGASGLPHLSVFRTLDQRLRQRLAAVQPWFLAAWLAGVALFSVRLLSREAVPAPVWLEKAMARLARRLCVSRPVRLLESAAAAVPSAVGAWRPILLLPVSAVMGLTPEQLEAVLAHELAHIRRHDYLVNILQTVTETLLFYHPAVWWVSHRIRVERENCCDDLAVEATGDARLYARALYDLERIRGTAPQLAVAASGGGPLWNRIRRLFPAHRAPADGASRWLAGALALGAILTMGAAARFSSGEAEGAFAFQSQSSEATAQTSTAPATAPASRPVASPGTAAEAEATAGPAIAASPAAPNASSGPMIAGAPAPGDRKEGDPAQPALASPKPVRHLSPEQLIAFRIHGVTPEFVEGIASLGYTRVSPDTLLSLRIHGATHEFLSGLQKLFGKLPLETCVELRIHGVSPEYVRALEAEGLQTSSPRQAVSMRIHGVDPEFVRAIHSLGFPDAGPEKLIAFRIHGVMPEFVREIQSLGYTSLSSDDLIALRIHGVTPEYIRKMNQKNGDRLPVDELLERRIHGFGEER